MEKLNKILAKRNLKRIYLSVFMFIILSRAYGQTTNEIVGHFKGNAKIIVEWCNLDSLTFDLNIDSLGNITGSIGNARIIQGKMKTNTFGSTKFIIEAELEGNIIEKEGIKRRRIKIPFDYVGGKIVGGFGTSGSKFGGKEKMILSGTDLILTRQ
jgi:hypothetical protein